MCSWRRKRRRRSASPGSSRRVVERPLTYDELIEIKKRLRRSSIDLDIHNSKDFSSISNIWIYPVLT